MPLEKTDVLFFIVKKIELYDFVNFAKTLFFFCENLILCEEQFFLFLEQCGGIKARIF